MYKRDIPVDVICQHKITGNIIPIKMKIQDENGEFQIYKILSYRPLIEDGVHITPDGLMLGNHIWTYECIISVFGIEKRIFLIYNISSGIWSCRANAGNIK